jgi:hypothetical protein
MAHEKCSRKIMTEVMGEYEDKKLKMSNEKLVKNRKQAVAIGLSRVEEKCKYSKNEYKELEKKVLEFVSSKPDEKIPLSRVIETKQLIEFYFKEKDYKKCKKYEILLWHYIVGAVSMKIDITDNIWQELKAIKKLEFPRF